MYLKFNDGLFFSFLLINNYLDVQSIISLLLFRLCCSLDNPHRGDMPFCSNQLDIGRSSVLEKSFSFCCKRVISDFAKMKCGKIFSRL